MVLCPFCWVGWAPEAGISSCDPTGIAHLTLISSLLHAQPCWNEYLTTRIEQNMVLSCTCPISECRAQPTTAFIYSIVSSKEIIAKVK